MTTVQSELPRISDAAARHTVDAAKAFKEFLRVRDALKEFEGSMHWKKVGRYEYLVHKKKGRREYLGARSGDTQARFDAFSAQKHKLESRLKTLRETVQTSERINKAVRAGAVPSPMMDVLLALDEAGLSQQSFVVGSPALYAYGQSSGLRMDAIMLADKKTSVVDDSKHHLLIFIDMAAAAPGTLEKVRHSIKTAAITPQLLPSCHKVALEVVFEKGNDKCASPRSSNLHSTWQRCPDPTWTSLRSVTCAKARDAAPLEKEVFDLLDHTPKFEQVVIGRTGRMAMMRTVDPLLFVTLCEGHGDTTSEPRIDVQRRKMQVDLVSRLLKDYLVTSKLEDEPGHGHVEHLKHLLSQVSATATPSDTACSDAHAHVDLRQAR